METMTTMMWEGEEDGLGGGDGGGRRGEHYSKECEEPGICAVSVVSVK